MSIRKIIGKRIAEERKTQGLSQEKLAEIVGLSATGLCFIENGEVYAKTDSIYKICKALNFPLEKLYKGY